MRISAFIFLFLLTSSLSVAFGSGVKGDDAVPVCETYQVSLKDYLATHEYFDDSATKAVLASTSTTTSTRVLRKLQESRLRNSNETPDGHSAYYLPSEQNQHTKYTVCILPGARVLEPVCIYLKFNTLRI